MLPRPNALRAAAGRTLDFEAAQGALEDLELGRADMLAAESWGEWDVTDPRGEYVTIAALDVLRDDLNALEQAIDSPGDGIEDYELPDGGKVWWFGEDDSGAQLAGATDRLRDFGLLARIGLDPLPERGGASPTESTLWTLEEPTRAKQDLLVEVARSKRWVLHLSAVAWERAGSIAASWCRLPGLLRGRPGVVPDGRGVPGLSGLAALARRFHLSAVSQ